MVNYDYKLLVLKNVKKRYKYLDCYLCASTDFSRRPFLPINCNFPSADVTKYSSPEDPDELETPKREIEIFTSELNR